MAYYLKIVECDSLLCVEKYLDENDESTYDVNQKKEFTSKQEAKQYSKRLKLPDNKKLIVQVIDSPKREGIGEIENKTQD